MMTGGAPGLASDFVGLKSTHIGHGSSTLGPAMRLFPLLLLLTACEGSLLGPRADQPPRPVTPPGVTPPEKCEPGVHQVP